MFDSISAAIENKLWKHQVEALDFAIDHLNDLDSPCLIRMPTGTGKTGIIACLTMLSNQGCSLVLTPWAHLRNQMVADLERDFWTEVKLTPPRRSVVPAFPSKAKEILESKEFQVIVATFATLNDLRLNYAKTYEKLAAAIELVVVDEGHYEPAVEWGKSVKGLNTKTVLLTATPYRNDLKLFRITDSAHSTYHFTHRRAIAEKIIREIRFEELDCRTEIATLSAEFAKVWQKMTTTRALPSQSPRAIVCCSGHEDIETAVSQFQAANLKAIGIHEQFEKRPEPYLLKNVPKDSRSTDAEIWVHQHKLTEGLDDHRFCCVALFTKIHNDRKLIQQIGRVLRRNNKDRSSPAVLVAPCEFSAEQEWTAYLEFETELKLLEPQHFRDVVETVLSAQPKVEYFEGRFRRQFSAVDLSHEPQVIISPSVLVREVGKGFSLQDYIEDCTDTLNVEDAVILGPDINAPCQKSETFALWVYASVSNSRSLQNTSLYEIKLETHCVVVSNGFVFMTDSSGNFPVEYLEENTTNLVAKQLARYLDKSFRPTHVSVDSSIPYDTVLRGADLRGHNLLKIAASLTDRVQICRSARGSSRTSERRYIGMHNGRVRKEVSEQERHRFELTTFVSWAESVATILKSKVAGSALFERYMPTSPPPANPIPKTISLDLVRLDLHLTLADGSESSLKNSSSDIDEVAKTNGNIYTCCFDLEGDGVAGISVALRVEYHPKKRRFWFKKEAGAAIRVSLEDDESSSKSLAEFLNQRQDIVLIGLQGGEIVYQGRSFYKIDYSYAEKVLIDLIERPTDAPPCKSEKGTKTEIAEIKRTRATTFPKRSLFRAVADQRVGLPFADEFLICDDLGTESADFVAANVEEHQLALIHAKVGDEKKISASAFHDVVAQAMKNLVYLTRNGDIPKGANSWRRDAKWNGTRIPRLYRAPVGAPVSVNLWNKLKADIIGSSNPELFVVLVTAGCCDLDELKKAVRVPAKRTPEVAQLLHLLDGLSGYARQLGVRLLVRDLPYAT